MKTLQFKTNINCGGCVAQVTPILNALEGIDKWDVDTNDPNKVLTFNTSILTSEEIKIALNKVGFKGDAL
nr:heavy-metal-associated domain-containing protein [Cytophaga aurantiaca]